MGGHMLWGKAAMQVEVPAGCALSIEPGETGSRAECTCGEWSGVYTDTMSTNAEKLATAGWYKHLQRVNRERAVARGGDGDGQSMRLGAGTDADPGAASGSTRLVD